MKELLIVAQMPNRPGGPEQALYGSSSLRRLSRYMGLDAPNDVYHYADVVNLIPQYTDVWPIPQANRRAEELLSRHHSFVVGLGAPVRRAFFNAVGFWGKPGKADWFDWHSSGYGQVAFCPHPSGLNRVWNDAYLIEAAEEFWTDALLMARAHGSHPASR